MSLFKAMSLFKDNCLSGEQKLLVISVKIKSIKQKLQKAKQAIKPIVI